MTAGTRVDDVVSRYLDHLTVERGMAPNTLASYGRDLDRYRRYLCGRGIVDLAEVTENDVREFLVDLRRGDEQALSLIHI